MVCCQVLHLCFQATQFCNMCMKSVSSSSFMSVIVTAFSFTNHLFSWRLTTNYFQLPYYFHALSSHWIWNLHHTKSCLLPYIMWCKKFIFINATQKFVLLNYCMQRQVTRQPMLCLQWHRNLSCFEGHIHRLLDHKIQENFKQH